jgi:hypothetical protein
VEKAVAVIILLTERAAKLNRWAEQARDRREFLQMKRRRGSSGAGWNMRGRGSGSM